MKAVNNLLLLLAAFILNKHTANCENETTLHLLTLLPPGDVAGSLLTAAELAACKINTRDDILPGYRLKLITADTEPCNETLITKSYRSFVKYAVSNGPFNVVAVTGMICPTVTQAISPLAAINLLQISAGAAPPVFANVQAYPRLYRVISSSAVQNDALLKLMEAFQWRRISILSDSTLIDHTGTADDFIAKVNQDPHLQLVSQEVVTPQSILPAFTRTILNAAKIIYVSMTAEEACKLLCAAYEQGRIWPTYVWIFRNLRVEDFGMLECNNGSTAMVEALDNVFLINYKLESNSPNIPLVSGDTYKNYRQQYRLLVNGSLPGNPYADALHDSVWAYALALNSSLGTLTSRDLKPYGLGKSNATSIIERNLRTLNFSGALGRIYFTDKREAETTVNILQVRSGRAVQVGYYNPHSQNLTLQSPPQTIPEDDFGRIRRVLHPAAPIVTLTVTAILIVANTVVLFLFVYHWNKPAIKATSPYLSLILLIGCYLLYMAVLLIAIREYNNSFGQLCQALYWFGGVGIELIYATLFVRLLRIYRIFFFIFEKPGKIWSDLAMIILILLIVSVVFLLFLLWATVDPFITRPFLDFKSQTMPPIYSVTLFCYSSFFWVWLSLIFYGCNSFTILAVGILAVMTRKIKLESFKDTKKVNAFVFTSILTLIICFAYSTTFATAGVRVIEVAYTFDFLPYLVIAVLCKVFLFIPKIWSAKFQKPRYSRRSSRSRSSSHSSFRIARVTNASFVSQSSEFKSSGHEVKPKPILKAQDTIISVS